MLSLVDRFQDAVDALDPAEDDHLVRLAGLTQKLAKDAVELIADHPYGEPAALVQLCAGVLQWLKAERDDPENRARCYARMQATIDLLVFCHAIAGFYGLSASRQRDDLEEHRARVADALRVP